MPQQDFMIAPGADALANVRWETGFTSVSLSYKGVLLTRITDKSALAMTGLKGQAPDGATLVLRLVAGPIGDMLTLERDGAPMHPGPIDYAAALNVAPASVVSGPGVATLNQQSRMNRARKWLNVVGILSLVGGVLLLVLASSSSRNYAHPGAVRATGAIVIALGAAYLVLSRLSQRRPVAMFGAAMALTSLNALLSVVALVRGGGQGALGVIVPVITAIRVRDAWKAAKESTSAN